MGEETMVPGHNLGMELRAEPRDPNYGDFDMDRLCKEIDKAFQHVADEKSAGFNEGVSKIVVGHTTKIENLYLKIMGSIEKEITDTMNAKKAAIVEEIAKGRTIIQIANREQFYVRHLDHPETENVVKSLSLYKKAMLVGPAGTGKTTMVAHIAEAMKLDFYKYSCSRDSSVHDLLGYKQPRSETYLETTFLKCYENGGMFLVDEYDAMSGDMALFFNGIADNSKFISVPHRDTNPTATKHKDFHLIMCGNTWGKGSYEYTGRDFQDKALLDRFRFCRHFINYHLELEKSLMGGQINFALTLRAELEKLGSYLSTRNIEDMAMALANGIKRFDVYDMAIQDLSETDKKHMMDRKSAILSA